MMFGSGAAEACPGNEYGRLTREDDRPQSIAPGASPGINTKISKSGRGVKPQYQDFVSTIAALGYGWCSVSGVLDMKKASTLR